MKLRRFPCRNAALLSLVWEIAAISGVRDGHRNRKNRCDFGALSGVCVCIYIYIYIYFFFYVVFGKEAEGCNPLRGHPEYTD